MQKISRVLILGDSPRIDTGFGRVNRHVANLLMSNSIEVGSVAGLTSEAPKVDDGIKTYVPTTKGDSLGYMDIEKAIDDFKPDICYTTADPGTAVVLTNVIPGTTPVFGYIPIEGGPISNNSWATILSVIPMMTCSQYGVDLIKQQLGRTIDYSYHGIDHDIFKVNGNRERIRKEQRWDDKFVIMCVAQNVRRKQIPRLIEAVSLLRYQYKQKDIVLYLHTVPFQDYWLDGWNLPEIAKMWGVEDIVGFNPKLKKWKDSVPEVSTGDGYPGLVDLYNAADLLVLPSQVEGFGLPIAEAMACGLPVLTTKYAAGWEVASPAGRGIPVRDWEVHKSGTLYGNVDVEALAKEILRLKRSPKELARMSEAGIARAANFTWDDFDSKLIPQLEGAISTHEAWISKNKGNDKGHAKEGHKEVALRETEGKDGLPEVSDIAKGKGEVVDG